MLVPQLTYQLVARFAVHPRVPHCAKPRRQWQPIATDRRGAGHPRLLRCDARGARGAARLVGVLRPTRRARPMDGASAHKP